MLLVILETTESVISVASIKMSATNRSVIAPNPALLSSRSPHRKQGRLNGMVGKGELRPDVVFPATNLASQKVTEACKGFLGPDGDWPLSAKAEGSLTARPTRRAGTKVGLSDPTVPSGRAVAQRIKVTLGLIG
ncbi:hypothetical protein V6N13_088954 [Hibiscus sabdariffa]